MKLNTYRLYRYIIKENSIQINKASSKFFSLSCVSGLLPKSLKSSRAKIL